MFYTHFKRPMIVRNLATFLLIVILACTVRGHILDSWSYQQMLDKADLVVIARFVSMKETDEHTTLNDMNPPSNVIGVVSNFEILLILKGSKEIKQFELHHYKLNDKEYSNGPSLVTVRKGRHPMFLLFLVKERDGKYAPVTGQTDPAALSVLELNGSVYE